jgi:holo-[acyl-carrier protein] synthase
MGIVSIGSDLTRVDRIEQTFARHGERFLARVFSAGERQYCDARKARFTHYAGRFAVKEAVMKVLGTGWTQGVRWVDIEVARERGGPPRVLLHGRCAEIAAERGIDRILITITHDAGLALALAVAEDARAD